ncbi:beta-ketoacyl synthase N-terminal-like domain-containing protein [Streptomyces sp. M10(2022)]
MLTGIGCVLPGTPDVHSFWNHISTGTSQVSRLERPEFAAAGLPVHAAAQLGDFDPPPGCRNSSLRTPPSTTARSWRRWPPWATP